MPYAAGDPRQVVGFQVKAAASIHFDNVSVTVDDWETNLASLEPYSGLLVWAEMRPSNSAAEGNKE